MTKLGFYSLVIKKTKFIQLFLAIFLLIIVLIALNEADSPDHNNLDSFNDYWNKKIELYGSNGAYQEFKNEYRNRSQAHTALHYFARLLFRKEGLESVQICDSDIQYACFHGVFQEAILANGPEIIGKLDEECSKHKKLSLTACQHGIGHGLAEYYGPENLLSSLEACEKLSWDGEIYGCSGGVFMEYNFPTRIEGVGFKQSVRKFTNNDPYLPCPKLPARFQPACYYEQVKFWGSIYKDSFETAITLCDGIGVENYKRYCYLGVGVNIPVRTNYLAKESLDICNEISAQPYNLFCKVGLKRTFAFMKVDPPVDNFFCTGLDGEFKSVCDNSGMARIDPVIKKDY